MKKLIFAGAFVALMNIQATLDLNPTISKVDLGKSKVSWIGKKVTGQHTGNISLKSANLEFGKAGLTGGSFEMNMGTITCTDMQGEYADKLVGHLKSEDFFSTDKFPVASFKITKATTTAKAGTYKVEGNLTIKGITKPVSFDAMLDNGLAKAKITIDRTLYDIRYGSGSFFDNLGDKAIDNNFILEVELAYTK